MKMTPFLSPDGMILGHIDLDMCRRTRNSIVIDNGPEDWSKCPTPTGPDDIYVEMYHMSFCEIKFCNRNEEVIVYHIVIDDKNLPDWFWDCKAIVAFSPSSWKQVR